MVPKLKSKRILPPCTQCGACCIATFDTHYHAELIPAEVRRGVFGPLGRYRRYVVSATGSEDDNDWALAARWRAVSSGPLRGSDVCACALLRGSPLRQVSCAIYRDRPRVCSAFARGSEGCLSAIRWLEDQVG